LPFDLLQANFFAISQHSALMFGKVLSIDFWLRHFLDALAELGYLLGTRPQKSLSISIGVERERSRVMYVYIWLMNKASSKGISGE
jgi:hypothetical protein